MDATEAFSRIWTAFDAGEILTACAWCGRVRIDETWVVAPPAALAAIDQRQTLTHTICERCASACATTFARAAAKPTEQVRHPGA